MKTGRQLAARFPFSGYTTISRVLPFLDDRGSQGGEFIVMTNLP
jgi:hypothetical protein